ncbi:MAG TPA: MFS transporter [Gammaproteobacteria bacterium]|nr:MFS transporter [Gammaproteobacteria bacterium]
MSTTNPTAAAAPAGKFAKDPAVDRALVHSIRDGMAYSISAGGGETYFSAFALFIGATAPEVALLTTLPPFAGALAQPLSAWAGRYLSRKTIVLLGVAIQALTWLPILALPYLVPTDAVTALLVLFVLYQGASNFAAPQWTSLMRDLVPDRRRGRYFGQRTRLTTMASFAALVACGAILHELSSSGETALGFVSVFAIAFLARVVSFYHLGFLYERAEPGTSPVEIHLRHWWDGVKKSGAVGFTIYFILMNLAVGIASPFFAVYMLRDLEFSYLEFTATTAASVLVQFLTLNTWGRIADVYGNRAILIVTSMALPVVPVLWLASSSFFYLLAAQAVSGLAWAGFTLSSGNLLYDLVPRSRRAEYVAIHNVGNAGCVFLGAMVGALLATVLPAREPFFGGIAHASNLLYLFALSGVVRGILAALVVRRVRELRKPRRAISAPALVLRVTGFNAMLGLLYEFIGRTPPAADERPAGRAERLIGAPSRQASELREPSSGRGAGE